MMHFGTAPRLSDMDVYYVCEIVKEAGRRAVELRAGAAVKKKPVSRDFVTDADVTLSNFLVEKLRARFPQDLIVSEEDANTAGATSGVALAERTWFIDPIDGTENYIANDGMYSIMVGLVVEGQPLYGWVYNPCEDRLYVAQPDVQVVRICGAEAVELPYVCMSLNNKSVRLMMGNRDWDQHAWVRELKGVERVCTGSVGLRVARILEGGADIYVHLAGKLKAWDTAAPAAMAFASGLEVGSFETHGIKYGAKNRGHEHAVVIGRPGSLDWARANLQSAPVAEPIVVAPPVSTMVVLP